MQLDQLVNQLEPVFDEAVVDGDDDELFASGYLRGHFDLVVAQLEMAGEDDGAQLLPQLKQAVDATKNELAPADQQHIANMLARLERQAKQA
ncbi:hypothetical protein CWI84_08790 [Idiomarina tyrosinivorans]|uniref:YfcL family protein n=1 Tax=Idiomarina tyrosinivorans TaxID=1445662 RepID=A0A432ZP89_9GAMM|nr:YfcL family protein [Idiomarina tyrosinivorans]RUO79719.1 hypothetical protein CWI84_08790 [Idiomarina tyrosinivorans]